MQKPPCLVTGGAGFIGSHLVDALVESGCAVRVLDNFSTGKRDNIGSACRRGTVEVIEGDVRDAETVSRSVLGCAEVFHMAALVSVQQSLVDPRTSFEINVRGSVNVLEAARLAGVRRVVLASSAAVYGDVPVPAREDDTPTRPLTPYGLDKLTAEHYAGLYARLYGLEAMALRYFNVYGPRQDPASPYSGVISIFADRLKRGAGVTVYGDGEQTRDFVHVSDVVRANMAAMTSRSQGFAACNIASGQETSINRLVVLLRGEIASRSPVDRQPARPGDIRRSCADIARARDLLGYIPHCDFSIGIRDLIAT